MVSKIHRSMVAGFDGLLSVGDISWSILNTKPGWLKLDGRSIGSAASGATGLAHAGARELFKALWQAYGNTELPIQTSTGSASTRGASADADFDANKRLPMPDPQSRMLVVAGSGTGLTARAMGSKGGEETHLLTENEMPVHNHSGTADSAGAHTHTASSTAFVGSGGGIAMGNEYNTGSAATSSAGAHTHNLSIGNKGGGLAHNNMPPYLTIGNLFIYAGV